MLRVIKHIFTLNGWKPEQCETNNKLQTTSKSISTNPTYIEA